ncbi:DeoR/GlpR family DNA-binding transcription regulator [Evansella halocellulosilytica]|uniref:DeoR/GlpR family DNA-binding transcription regulator n=1 Tax=Evansella halocellulosilytica TaxID=2011013 RepID=UPI000BB9B6FA|nr:DeoR/GlpR family DNA-binding transcription regulator [Evansella halocellulosilytica]
MLPLERRNWIEKYIQEHGKVDIESASKALRVSPMTIRRDLTELENDQKVIRTHGGAISPKSLTEEVPYSSKESRNILQKRSIALKAVNLVKDHSTIILDSGTTTLELARLLKEKEGLTIVTNDINIANELMNSSNKVIVTGGEMQQGIGAIFGTATQEMLKIIHADLFFLGAHAIDYESGVTAPTFEKSVTKQMMTNSSNETWLLADNSKFDKRAFSKVCLLSEIDGIITDYDIADSIKSAYKSKVEVLIGGEQKENGSDSS